MRNEDAIFFSSACDVFRRSFHERSLRFAAPFRADSETILTARNVLREQINVIVPPFLFRCLLRALAFPQFRFCCFRLTSMLLSFCCSSRLLVRVCVYLCVKSLSWRYATDCFVKLTGADGFCCCCVFSFALLLLSQCGRFPRSVACDNVPGRHDDDRTLTLG